MRSMVWGAKLGGLETPKVRRQKTNRIRQLLMNPRTRIGRLLALLMTLAPTFLVPLRAVLKGLGETPARTLNLRRNFKIVGSSGGSTSFVYMSSLGKLFLLRMMQRNLRLCP